jgi:hypothetical protein
MRWHHWGTRGLPQLHTRCGHSASTNFAALCIVEYLQSPYHNHVSQCVAKIAHYATTHRTALGINPYLC